jgi:hypothetical protein
VGTFAAHRDTKRAFALRVQDCAVRGVEVDRRLGSRAIVVVMESADQRRRDDTPGRRRPDGVQGSLGHVGGFVGPYVVGRILSSQGQNFGHAISARF